MFKRSVSALPCFAVLLLAGFAVPALAQIPAGHIRIHYHRPDAAYTGWTVYAFGDTTEDAGILFERQRARHQRGWKGGYSRTNPGGTVR